MVTRHLLLFVFGTFLFGQTPAETARALPTLYLIGDSTVRNGQGDGSNGQWGWGEPIVSFFDASKINVVDRAYGGRSPPTHLNLWGWGKDHVEIQAGDFVIIPFGHTDNAAVNED